MAGKSSHFRSIWLTPSASLVFLLLLGGTAPAATLSFRPVPGHGAALVFKLTGVKSEEVRAAYLERKGRRDKLNVHVARKAAERGVLKLLTPRKKQSPGSRRHVLGRAKSDPKLILVVADSASVGPASPSPSGVLVAGSTPTMFRAAADAYVSSANRSRNYGTRRYLYADSSPRVRSYLRFNVKGLKGLVSRATLELYARGSSSVGLDVRPVSNNEWNEKTIIYTKARSIKPAVGSTGTFGSGRWVRLDVTSLVSGNGAVSFVVSTPSSKAIKFASRETGRKAPRLETVTPLSALPPLFPSPNQPVMPPWALAPPFTPPNQLPAASFTISPNPATAGANVSFNGLASSDPDGQIADYRWDLDGDGSFETDSGQSASASHTYSAGHYDVGLRVTDDDGATAVVRGLLTVNAPTPSDTTPPTVSIRAPSPGAIVSGAGVAVAATASDNVGVSDVQFRLDGENLDSKDTSRPYAINWDTTRTADGIHALTAVARDAAANESISAPVAVSVTNSPPPSDDPCGNAVVPPLSYQHAIWIVFENRGYDSILGSPDAPYINSLAQECGIATNFFAETHPSLPNYIAMTSGSTQGITDDAGPSSHALSVPSIFSQLGSDWRSLEESMPSNCLRSDSGTYAVRHNPAAYYTNIDCAALDVPLTSTSDFSARFTFVTPNLCNDMHDCSVQTGDQWLQNFMQKVFASSEYQLGATAVFITWDEGNGSDSNRIPTLVISPYTPAGTRVSAAFNQYSLLRTTEELLGLEELGGASSASSMRSAFGL